MLSAEFLITSLIVVLLPGTGVIYTVSTGLLYGVRASIFAACGCTLGIVPHLIASILGLTMILHMSAMVFQIVKFLGVAYLLYLGWSMWKQSGSLEIKGAGRKTGGFAIGLRGILINLLNPKLSIFFLAFLPQFLPAQADAPLANMLVLSLVFMALTLIVFILYGILAHGVSQTISSSPKSVKYLQRLFSATFFMLGAKLALTEQ